MAVAIIFWFVFMIGWFVLTYTSKDLWLISDVIEGAITLSLGYWLGAAIIIGTIHIVKYFYHTIIC